MIGWAPFLLTGVAGALVVIVALDASSGFHASAYISGDTVATWLHNALNASVQWLSHLGVQDCILIGASAFLLAWGWVRAAAFVRLGTIQIADLSCDDDKLAPTAAKAVLQQALGDHGLLPPSGVPSGSPSVASIADAISKAPIPQANWLGSLIGLIPWPPVGDGLSDQREPAAHGVRGRTRRVSLRLRAGLHGPAAERPARGGRGRRPRRGDHARPASTSTGPSRRPRPISTPRGPAGVPGRRRSPIARRSGSSARSGYDDAHKRLHGWPAPPRSGQHDRTAARRPTAWSGWPPAPRTPSAGSNGQVEALAAYTSIRIRRPSIFEAGFRASVLMSVLASEPVEKLDGERPAARRRSPGSSARRRRPSTPTIRATTSWRGRLRSATAHRPAGGGRAHRGATRPAPATAPAHAAATSTGSAIASSPRAASGVSCARRWGSARWRRRPAVSAGASRYRPAPRPGPGAPPRRRASSGGR